MHRHNLIKVHMFPNDPTQSAPITHDNAPNAIAENVAKAPAKPGKLLRLPAVEALTGLKKSTLYAAVKSKTLPAPVRLSARAVAWREEDIDRWISERVKTDAPA